METGYYYGIFNYSPSNKNPKLYTEGHWRWESLQSELKTKREYHDKQLARIMTEENKGPKHAEYVESLEKEYKDEVFNMTVDVEKERVFYILDENFNQLFETKKVFVKGNWSPTVKKALKQYKLGEFAETKSDKRVQTAPTLEALKERVRIHKSLEKFMTPEKEAELIALFKK